MTKNRKPCFEAYQDAVAEGVCLLIGYPTDITEAQFFRMKKAFQAAIPADDYAVTLSIEIQREEARRLSA